MRKKIYRYFFFLFFLSVFSNFYPKFEVRAERLAFKAYSAGDGLASDDVYKVVPDSQGFLWFCTGEGLSRFDGYKFKNYTQDQGLPHRSIRDLLITTEGDYLVATANGLAVFNPYGTAARWNNFENRLEENINEPPLFKTYSIDKSETDTQFNIFQSLAQNGNGDIYAATAHGVYRIIKSKNDWTFHKVDYDWKSKEIDFNKFFTDSRKDIWIAASTAIYWMSKNGEIKKINDFGGNNIFEDRDGKIWIDSGGNDIGSRVYEVKTDGSNAVLTRTYTTKDGLAINIFSNAIAHTEDGRIFVTSDGKFFEFLPNAADGEKKFKQLDHAFNRATTDRNGNIWFISPGKGVAKYSPRSFITYDQRDGIPEEFIRSISSDRAGNLVFTTGVKNLIRRDQSGNFEKIVPSGLERRMWMDGYLDFQSTSGEWWVPSIKGLRRYPKIENFSELAKTLPSKIYTTADGLTGDQIYAVFEDSRHDIWISSYGLSNALFRLEHATGKLFQFTTAEGLPENNNAISFGEDAAGNVWIGFYLGDLIRFKDGKLLKMSEAEGFPNDIVAKMLSDKKGRMWFASDNHGLFRVDNPDDDAPRFVNVSTADGLSSNRTFCVLEDDEGKFYVGTGRGINLIDFAKQRVRIFTQADGLPGNTFTKCYKSPDGKLWFSSNNSLVQFVPQSDTPSKPPPIYIDSLNVNGNARNVSDLGEKEIKNLELESNEKQIEIGFFGISLDRGETLRYQYKLEGQDWSQPSEQRTASFDLSPGVYNFQVQAVNADGIVSENPARVSFKINPPFWRTWWFLILTSLLLFGSIFILDRYRVAKTKQVEAALVTSKESENRFRTLAETASDAILTIDEDSTILFANEAIEKVFGYSPAEITGQKLTILMPERMRGGHNAGFNRYLSTNRKNINWAGVALPGQHKEGHEIPLEVSFGEFERDGKRYFTGIARDVSERKRAEEALQKSREERLAELQRVRSRIATDLHDDIGSSLTQIAVLTEVVRGQASHIQAETLAPPLERIKSVSKELVSVMSDVVWAINPQKDFLHDLVLRMRRFASDVYTGRGIKFEFIAPELESNVQLGANIRREIFAIFKESVNNSVKYSECTLAAVKFQIEENYLILEVSDNGKGFDTDKVLSDDFRPENGGNGLINIRRRADELGGFCKINSESGKGTTIIVNIPLQNENT